MENISFKDFMHRLRQSTPIQNQSQLAEELGVGRSAVSLAKNKDSVPSKWIFHLAEKYVLDSGWLASGKVEKQDKKTDYSLPSLKPVKNKQSFKNCFPFQENFPDILLSKNFLKQLRANEELLYLFMPDRSMEPEIFAQDLLLADPGTKQLTSGSIYLIEHEEQIMVRRVEIFKNIIRFLSPNQEYNNLQIEYSEFSLKNILGKVILVSRIYF